MQIVYEVLLRNDSSEVKAERGRGSTQICQTGGALDETVGDNAGVKQE